MAEQAPPPRVRDLTALIVVIDDKELHISLLKRKNVSEEDRLTSRAAEFGRKVNSRCFRLYHSVAGAREVDDHSVDEIFESQVIIPYEQKMLWPHAVHGTTGVIRLDPPRSGETVPSQTRQSQQSGNRTVRRAAHVRAVIVFGRISFMHRVIVRSR